MNPVGLRRGAAKHERATPGVLPEDVFQFGQITAPRSISHG
jgi:hypothetical protein